MAATPPPPATPAQQALLALLRAASRLRQRSDAVFAASGLTAPQFNVLRILRGAGPEGLPTLTVAERLIDRAPGITRMMDRLEAKRLVRRERGGGDGHAAGDRRCVRCRITAPGLALLAQLDAPVGAAAQAAFAGWSDHGLVELAARMARVSPEEKL